MQEGSQTVISALGSTDTDQFASRVFHQVPAYMIWKAGPQSKAKDAFQQKWSHLYPFTEQGKTGASNHDLDNSSLENRTMVHSSSGNVCRESSRYTEHPKTSNRSSGKPSSTGDKQILANTGLESLITVLIGLEKAGWLV